MTDNNDELKRFYELGRKTRTLVDGLYDKNTDAKVWAEVYSRMLGMVGNMIAAPMVKRSELGCIFAAADQTGRVWAVAVATHDAASALVEFAREQTLIRAEAAKNAGNPGAWSIDNDGPKSI